MTAVLNHQKLRERMHECGFTQESLAERIDMSDRFVRMLCRRDYNVSMSVLYALSKALTVDMEEMLTVRED